MGRNKALLPWQGRSLVEYVAAEVRKAAGTVTLIGNPGCYQSFGIASVADRWTENGPAGTGPLAGLYTALSLREAQWNLVAACDLPTIQASFLHLLFESAESTDFEAVLLRDGNGRVHPLCAVYHASCLGPVEKALQAGDLSLMRLLPHLKVGFVEHKSVLANVNSPSDWEAIARA